MNATLPVADLSKRATLGETVLDTDALLAALPAVLDPQAVTALAATGAAPLATLLRSPADGDILRLWRMILKDSDAAFDRDYAELQRQAAAPTPAQGIAAIGQAVVKAVVAALEKQGKVSKFRVATVGRDPKRPIVYYYTKDGKIISHCPPLDGQDFLPNVVGFDFNFFGNFGYFTPKEYVVLVLPNGDCILIRSV